VDKTVRNVLIGAAVWSAGIYLYQRINGVIVVNGQALIPGFLDPIGLLLGYPNQVTVSVGPITDADPSNQLEQS
jgi:hypothetical protein